MDFHIADQPLTDSITLVVVLGRLNAASAPQVKNCINKLVSGSHNRLVFDMSGVSFMDSSGLASLVSGLKATRERGGWLKLAGVGAQVAGVFKMTKLDGVFEMYPSVSAAQNS
jgi:anti-sigma B factor antagonist